MLALIHDRALTDLMERNLHDNWHIKSKQLSTYFLKMFWSSPTLAYIPYDLMKQESSVSIATYNERGH